jgi:gamma-glutamylcyclotransferase (GGCT)/AIG2-like uncharacterized protein YtfP
LTCFLKISKLKEQLVQHELFSYGVLNITNIFVYGTLKPRESNYQRYCAGKVLEAKRAIALGELFSLPFGYPAMTPGKSLVHGFLLSFPDSTILSHLDWLEDYDPQRPAERNEYNRQLIETYNSAFTLLGRAWVYLMTPQQVRSCNGVLIPDGWWSCRGLSSAHYPDLDKAN